MIDNQKMSIILPGRIISFDHLTQTASVLISVEAVYSNALALSDTRIRLPIEGVPVHTLSGGGWSLTMPILEGDSCLLLFSQIGYDHWLHEDKDSAGTLAAMPKPWLKRQFSQDDGFAIVGLNTIPRAVESFTSDGSQWRNKDATQSIHLKDNLSIEVTSPLSVTVFAPSVIVNCEEAKVNASTSTVVDCPETEVTGNLKVGGKLDVTGKVTGEAFNEVVVESHTHLDAENRPTLGPS